MDPSIIENAIKKDIKAITTIVRQYKDYVYRIAFSLVKDEDTAKDLSQESFIKIIRKIDSYQQNAKFETWLYRIVYNTCIDFIRSKKSHFIEINDKTKISYETPEHKFEKNEQSNLLVKLIARLPEKQRLVLNLYYYQHLSYQEIANICDEKISNIKILIFRAKKKLKEILEQEKLGII